MSDAESLIIDLPDEAATVDLGRALASVVQQADVIALWGNLGAGKTTLARGLIQAGLPGGEDVPSPTFTRPIGAPCSSPMICLIATIGESSPLSTLA